MLSFKLDENVLGEAAATLRAAGHDVSTALEQQLGGQPDQEILHACRDESRVLVTLDVGLGDIRAYPPSGRAGIWVLRPARRSVDVIVRMVQQALGVAEREPAARRLWVIDPGQVRIRD